MVREKPWRVVIAPDKFKGSLAAPEVAAALAAGIARETPDAEVRQVPVADGGDGTVDAFVAAGWERVRVDTVGPTGAPHSASYAVRGNTAVVELAAAVGLVELPGGRTDPMGAGTYGLGVLIRHALDHGIREVVLGLGGSASTDGGAGMLQALGLHILDEDGAEIGSGAAALARARRLDHSALHPAVRDADFVLAGDVDNPLLGPDGAAAVFAPQKGASPRQCAELEAILAHWSRLVDTSGHPLRTGDAPQRGADLAGHPGAGAAGGTGFGAMAVLGARQRSGIEVILELIDFAGRVRDADVVVTGEGAMDEQTLRGKAPAGVAAAAAGAPVVAVAGRCALSPERLRAAGFARCYPLSDLEPDPERSIAEAARLLEELGARIAGDYLR
ncbi:glycerate kinase [Nocardia africana]|uniref:Glycerate kinase n=1 Tax=Nocardia africana TaxID=134964 RepID=A0A378WIP9_9NOCA|nr:glycerate kinase [Nocardia africana]MCC3318066.1 glycerate kinase [Nocardia africana]SUA40792.1 Glycerate kinase [Nocardia africana]